MRRRLVSVWWKSSIISCFPARAITSNTAKAALESWNLDAWAPRCSTRSATREEGSESRYAFATDLSVSHDAACCALTARQAVTVPAALPESTWEWTILNCCRNLVVDFVKFLLEDVNWSKAKPIAQQPTKSTSTQTWRKKSLNSWRITAMMLLKTSKRPGGQDNCVLGKWNLLVCRQVMYCADVRKLQLTMY